MAEQPETDKVWAIKLPDGKPPARIVDLPVAVLEELCAELPDVDQGVIAFLPLTDIRVARRLWRTVMERNGITVENFDTITLDDLYGSFELIADDTPTMYVDGAPKAEGDGSTDGS